MSVPTNIRIQIVLLTAKFESPMIVKRKLQVEFGKNAPSENSIKVTFQRFCDLEKKLHEWLYIRISQISTISCKFS
jgi:hypothetical protein